MIGIYDSGMGGLSVLREVRGRLPQHDLTYLADAAFCPYGPRPIDGIRDRALACSTWLYHQGAQVVVVACNTATSAAIADVRAALPIPVVGMEPGIKPAIAATRNRRIGVLATDGTLSGPRFATLVQRFADGVEVQTVPAPGLVTQVEAGDLDGPETRRLLGQYFAPLQDRAIDTLVLGCTHFPFLAPLIRELAGPDVALIDTGPAVARQVTHIVHSGNVAPGCSRLRFVTTGDPAQAAPVFERLCGAAQAVEVEHATIASERSMADMRER